MYEATDTLLDRNVAIKRLLPPDESESPELSEDSLQKETAALSALQHPNIVTIFDVGADEDGQFVVMELIDGENIEEATERETFERDPFAEFASQALDALASAQRLSLLHRDIKPRNLMVRWLPDGKPLAKVLDFGLAKFAPKPALQTMDQNKAVLGSVFYMAPEQFERRPLDPRTDLYSLGCVFYYMLSGHDPFSGETAAQVMTAHLEHKVHHLKEFRPDLPQHLADWVMWMINREMEDRPQNADEAVALLADLRKNDYHEGGTAAVAPPVVTVPKTPVPATLQSSRSGRRRTLLSGATGAVIERDATTGLVPDIENRKLTTSSAARPITSATAIRKTTGATGIAPSHQATGTHFDQKPRANRGLIFFGIGATAIGLALVAIVLVASLNKNPGEDDPDPDSGFAVTTDGGMKGVTGDEESVFEWKGHGGDDLFSPKNWRGGSVPAEGGAGVIPFGLTRSMKRVDGALSLTVSGKLNVESYYDVIGLGKEAGFLKVPEGGEVIVGSKGKNKLVIGRKTSGWAEVKGKLSASSTLEVGDTKGTKARLTVEGGEVTAPKLITGDCDWEIAVTQNGKLVSTGEARFDKGKGRITVADGGVLRAQSFFGIDRREVEVRIEKGGKIRMEGVAAESVLTEWKDGGKIKAPNPLEVKKVAFSGKTYFDITAK